MASTALDKKVVQGKLEAASRDISIIWNEAINQYNKTANEHDESERVTLAQPTFKDTQDMREFGDLEMQKFRFFRHQDKKIDRLRTLFMQNIEFIDAGSKQLLNAVSTSFPPALAISTAMTFVLTGFKSQRADYDVVANFFEDMNNFLQRVTIIEKRVPTKKAYQNALIDVFTSMLSLCAVARKYIMQGRFKKWVINSIFGGDADLSGSRQEMDTRLSRLQSATEFAILDNSENMLEQQMVVGDSLAKLRRELDRNGEIQEQIAASQNAALDQISQDMEAMRNDIKKLLFIQQAARSVSNQNVTKTDELSGNVVRHFYGLTLGKTREPLPDMAAVLANLAKSQVEDTGSWLFEHRDWLAWVGSSSNVPSVLWLEGGPGTGKTHLSFAMYQQLCGLRKPGQEVCTAYFSCRRPDNQRRHARDLLRNCAIQIADQSPAVRQRLEAMWRNFQILARVTSSARQDFDSTSVDNDIFIYENFSESSDNELFVVVDGINHFYNEELDDFLKVLRKVKEEKLRIKFVVTVELTDEMTKSTVNMIQSQSIQISKDQILPDLRKIIWKRINSEDSAYDGLRKLSKHSKQKLARRIEENADNLLYVDEMLRFLASGAREGNIENLLDSMPINLTELYEAILQRSVNGFSTDSVQSLKSIVMWLTFSYHPLTLERLSLLAESAGLNSERIRSFVLQFFEVDILSKDTACLLGIEFTELFEDSIEISKENLESSDTLRLQARNRATEIFFSSADLKHELRTSYSDAHRRLFLDTVNIIVRQKTSNKSLYEYSVEHSLIHWHNIVPEQHTKEEQLEVCLAFTRLISDDHFAEGLATHPYCQYLGQITSSGWGEKWTSWSHYAIELDMAPESIEYWRGQHDALYPLVTALVRYWLRSDDVGSAVQAWKWAEDIRKTVRRLKSLKSDGDRDRIPLAGILGGERDSHAHFAIASVLAKLPTSNPSSCIRELRLALAQCQDAALRARCYIQLALVCVEAERWNMVVEGGSWKDAVGYCKMILEDESTLSQPKTSEKGSNLHEMPAASDVKVQVSVGSDHTGLVENLAWQQSIRAEALYIQGLALKGLEMNIEAAESFREARQVSAGIVPVDHLLDELLCLQENPESMIDRLLSFSYIDRLRFLTGEFRVGEPGHDFKLLPERIVLPASAKSQKTDAVVEMYREVIKGLDVENAGAPIRVDLARILWRLRYNIKSQQQKGLVQTEKANDAEQSTPGDIKIRSDNDIREADASETARTSDQGGHPLNAGALLPVKEAKVLLNQVLDSVSEEKAYKLTDRDPLSVANAALLLMTDILLETFRSSKKVEDKVQILLQAKELPRRKFIASQPLITDDVWNSYRTVVAHMLKKIGPMSEYEQVMGNIFDAALAGYSDDTKYNDQVYLTSLSRIFMMVPSLHQFGEMLSAVNFDEDIYGCDGICLPISVFDYWESDEPWYRCLICPHSRLCQSCYKIRMRWNTDPTTKSATDPDFCCPNGQYLRDPVEAWEKRDGCMYFNPSKEEDERICIKVDSISEHIMKAWKDAWGVLAFGI